MKAKNQMMEHLKEYFGNKGKIFCRYLQNKVSAIMQCGEALHIALQDSYQKRMARHLRRIIPFLIFNDTY